MAAIYVEVVEGRGRRLDILTDCKRERERGSSNQPFVEEVFHNDFALIQLCNWVLEIALLTSAKLKSLIIADKIPKPSRGGLPKLTGEKSQHQH
jgi:hypothetical protein